MNEVKAEKEQDRLIIHFSGHIDSNNAPLVEQEVKELLADSLGCEVIIDAEKLEYISSAGLRVLLHVRKQFPNLRVINTNAEVYEILDMTGFTDMIQVEKAYKTVSIEGCEVIGQGANGTIYRIDKDNVVKVYKNADALADIQHEREVARTALILGIPTAISYDVVKVGDSYGSVFELLNAKSFSEILSEEPERMDWCVKEYVDMLHRIHGTKVPAGDLPDFKDTAIGWARVMQNYLPEKYGKKLMNMIQSVPKNDHMIHGDYHTKNLELTSDEVLLIDMDTLSVGHPVFELGSMYNAFIGFSELNHDVIKKFQGFDYDTSQEFWQKVLVAYLGTDDEEFVREVEDKAKIMGYTRLIRRSIRLGGLDREEDKKEIDYWTEKLIALLDKHDTLLFTPNILKIIAENKRLPEVNEFINAHIEGYDISPKTEMQIEVAVEEIYSNVANYAYAPATGEVEIRAEVEKEGPTLSITFIDEGMEYNPLAKEDPDISLPAEERDIGGLGIFMTKKSMDEVLYEYTDGKNMFTIKKNLV